MLLIYYNNRHKYEGAYAQTHFLGTLCVTIYKEAYIMTENNISAAELENEGHQVKTYTEDVVRELLLRETDRRVSSALKKQEKDY